MRKETRILRNTSRILVVVIIISIVQVVSTISGVRVSVEAAMPSGPVDGLVDWRSYFSVEEFSLLYIYSNVRLWAKVSEPHISVQVNL